MFVQTMYYRFRTMADEAMGTRIKKSANGLSTQVDEAAKEVIKFLVPPHQLAKGVTGSHTIKFPTVTFCIPFLNGHGTIPIATEITIASSSYEEDFTGRVRKAITLATCFQINTGLGLISMCNLLKKNTEGKQTGFLALGLFILLNRLVKLTKNVLQFNFMKNLENLNIFPFLQLLMEYQKYKFAQYIAGISIQLHDHPDKGHCFSHKHRIFLEGNDKKILEQRYQLMNENKSLENATKAVKNMIEDRKKYPIDTKFQDVLNGLYEEFFFSVPSESPQTDEYTKKLLGTAEEKQNSPLVPASSHEHPPYTNLEEIYSTNIDSPVRLSQITSALSNNISIINRYLKNLGDVSNLSNDQLKNFLFAHALKGYNQKLQDALPFRAQSLPIVPKELARTLKQNCNKYPEEALLDAINTVYLENFPAILKVHKSVGTIANLSKKMIQVLEEKAPTLTYTRAQQSKTFSGDFKQYTQVLKIPSAIHDKEDKKLLMKLITFNSGDPKETLDFKRIGLFALYMGRDKKVNLETSEIKDINRLLSELNSDFHNYDITHKLLPKLKHRVTKNIQTTLSWSALSLGALYFVSFFNLYINYSLRLLAAAHAVNNVRRPLTPEQQRERIDSID